MKFFVILTEECNLNCTYCRGKDCRDEDCAGNFDFTPTEIEYGVRDLARFCAIDPDCGIILYGGEPLLRIEKLKEIIDNVPARDFILQTNGLLLDRLPARYLRALSGIQVSVDGDRTTTDGYRGKGVYVRCIKNARSLRGRGFGGELIARMTVAEKTDIHKSVNHLLGLGIFDAVHWQLDANFAPDNREAGLGEWARSSYMPGIEKLAKEWMDGLSKGNVIRIYPFLGIMNSLLSGESARLRCGAGYAHYAIQTDGKIVPCPVMAGMKDFYSGSLKSDPRRLKRFSVSEPCSSCSILAKCGGRCLYANVMKHWGEGGNDEVCKTVRHLISVMESIRPGVERLLDGGNISLKDLDYTRFNSCEIIP